MHGDRASASFCLPKTAGTLAPQRSRRRKPIVGVGAVVPWAQADVGAIATQASANTAYGPDGLALLSSGKNAREALQTLIDSDPRRGHRQLGIADAQGNVANYTGSNCIAWAGGIEGPQFAVQGNILAGTNVVAAMADAYRSSREVKSTGLADWLVASLKAGEDAGGDKRGKQSAALLVVRAGAGYGGNDRYIDLRVDDHAQPVLELGRLLDLHKKVFPRGHRNPPRRKPNAD